MQIFENLDGSVMHLEFGYPPVNALSVGAGLVGALHQAIKRAISDPATAAIVLSGNSGKFSAGADISDFDRDPERLDQIRALLNLVENSSKPIAAAIDGLCLGGGLELALAAHYRVATANARFGFPEINLGLLPGAGGTQRGPRLIGAANALDLMLSGKIVAAGQARQMGLADLVVDGDPVAAAMARFKGEDWRAARRSGDLPPPADLREVIDAGRGRRLSLAGEKIVACVEAIGTMGFAEGLAFEASSFGELMISDQSRALRHGFSGRRTVSRIPGMPIIDAKPVRSVTVIGGGLMGTGIAIALLNAGLEVKVIESREDARAKARASIVGAIGRDADKGRISRQSADERIAALSTFSSLHDAPDADLFIEAVFEDLSVKKEVFTALDRLAHPDAILASNTSTLDLNAIAEFTSRPHKVVGLHFFSPANVMRLLEIVRGEKTSHDTLISAMVFAKAIGKTGVVAGVCDGFIGNRIFEEYLRQAWFLLEEGALPQQIDRALEQFGMAMGPCRVMDLAGQDIGWNIRKRRAVEQPDRPYSKIPDLVCERGRFGQKTGAGFYIYSEGRTSSIDPEIEELISGESRRIGLARRSIPDSEIVERCVYAMVNEGARIVEEDIAFRPVDVDIVYLDGYGFPSDRGGPMFHADLLGVRRVHEAITGFAAGRHGWAWTPSQLLIDLAQRNGTFGELNK